MITADNPADPPLTESKPIEERIVTPELEKAKVVVVDDNDLITRMIQRNLEVAGFQNPRSFNDPIEALRFVGRNGADVILLDLNMPQVGGLRVLQFLRENEASQFIPVIILTSAEDEETKLEALRAGANDYLTKPVNPIELVQRICNTLTFHKHSGDLKERVKHVESELRTDSLTTLKNRRAFEEQLQALFTSEKHQSFSLILLDIDNFKTINDRYGHVVGDNALRFVSEVIQSGCSPDDSAFRIGGDEFAVICRSADLAYPNRLAQKFQDGIESNIQNSDGHTSRLTTSIGIASYSDETSDRDQLFNMADSALYQSKRQGRNSINIYSKDAPPLVGDAQRTVSVCNVNDPQSESTRDGLILIVDDESIITDLLEYQLGQFGYKNVISENDATRAVSLIKEQLPDLIILDVNMPEVSGLDILAEVKQCEMTSAIPVLIMTSSTDEGLMVESLKLQAGDFLTKPAKPAELDARVFNSLKMKKQHDQLMDLSRELSREVDIRTAELFATRRETILCLARAGESRDKETGNHVIRVGKYAAIIAHRLGMDDDYVGWIELAAQLHDVGKLSIPDAIIRKPGRLTPEERQVIETHCDHAAEIFFGNSSESQITSPLLKMAAVIASTHHEKWDGTGYPRGLKGDQIPLEGRITAVADVFDALSSKRAYKCAIEFDKCVQIIVNDSGTHFDPAVVDAFVAANEEIMQAREELQGP